MYYQRAFICGHFSFEGKFTYQEIKEGEWTPAKESITEDEREGYYLNFQKFILSNKNGGCTSFKLVINKDIWIGKGKKKGNETIYVNELRLYLFPFNIALFSIEIEQKSDSIKKICANTRRLRNYWNYGDISSEWNERITMPLRNICKKLKKKEDASFHDLVENCNRMKVFQVVWSDKGFTHLDQTDKECLLYNLCTADAKTDAQGLKIDENYDYIANTIDKSRLSVFKEWEAISLLDSFTVLYYEKNPIGISKIDFPSSNNSNAKQSIKNNKDNNDEWGKRFRLLYIYALFQKCYLFNLNNLNNSILHKRNNAPKSNEFTGLKNAYSLIYRRLRIFLGIEKTQLANLTSEMKKFEFEYVFHNISYYRFTTELYSSFYSGLEVASEKEEVYRLINAKQTELSASKGDAINMVILLLTLFTLFEAISAACELLNNIIPYDKWLPSSSIGYLLFSTIFLVLFGRLIWIYIRDFTR